MKKLLDRINTNGFSRESRELIQNGAKTKLKIIIGRRDNILKLRSGKKLIEAAESMNNCKENFTPNQLSFIDNIYEKSWEAKGFESVKTKHDFVKKW